MHSDNERWYFRFDHPWLIFLRPFATIKGEFDETEDQLSRSDRLELIAFLFTGLILTLWKKYDSEGESE